jgi:hypothetical protein
VPHQLEVTASNFLPPSTPRTAKATEAPAARLLERICRAGWEVRVTFFSHETPRPLWQVSGWNGEATIWAEARSLGRALKSLARQARDRRD